MQREGAAQLGAVVVCGEMAALDRERVDDALGGRAVVVDIADHHRATRLDRLAERGQAVGR